MPNVTGIGREYIQLDVSQLNEREVKDVPDLVKRLWKLVENQNRALRQTWDRLDALEGRRGTVPLGADIDLNEHKVTNSNADITEDGDLVSKAFADATYGAIAIARALSIAGTNPLNVSGLRGQLNQAQPAAAPEGNSQVILDTALNGTLFVENNILYRVDASVSPAVAIPVSGTAVVLSDTHALRVSDYDPADYAIGTLLYETDRHYLYAVEDNTGNVWQYVAGVMVAVVASRPADLGVNDKGAFFYATDQSTCYVWTGAAWDTVSVYATAALTANAIVLGGGTRLVTVLGSLGTTTTVLHGNAAGAPTFGAVSLTADTSGVLPETKGGTNQSTYTAGDLLYASAANTLSKLAAAASGKVLTAQGAGTAPAWSTASIFGSSAYTITNVTTDRSYDANATSVDELADTLGTLVADLQAKGILS